MIDDDDDAANLIIFVIFKLSNPVLGRLSFSSLTKRSVDKRIKSTTLFHGLDSNLYHSLFVDLQARISQLLCDISFGKKDAKYPP